MRRSLSIFTGLLLFFTASAQTKLDRPKLVVSIVADQMRWDFLYRYYDRYAAGGGFKRLLSQGFSCENTSINYTPSQTACGHASIFSGSVPGINGITGNEWWDKQAEKYVYSTQDDSVTTVGSTTEFGKMSPRNMLVTTIGDELRLATNFKAKVIGLSLKDRGGILAAGHSANAAYWYDTKTGDWITSSFYMKQLPAWVNEFNAKKLVDKYYQEGWKTLHAPDTYEQKITDGASYGNKTFGVGNHLPYDLSSFIGKRYSFISATPHGNSFTLQMAKAAIQAEQLGADSVTDFLAVSLSSPDYIGHSYGPNSMESEDNYLRLDKDLGDFLNYLDATIGAGQYLLFLSADHGAAHVPAFMKERKIPAGNVNIELLFTELNKLLLDKFKVANLVADFSNYQVSLSHKAIVKGKLNETDIRKFVIDYLSKQQGIATAFDLSALAETTLNATIKNKITNGYFPARSGDIQVIFQPQWIENFELGGTTHGLWNPYDAHIPLIWFGWKIPQGVSGREISITDIAPTVAALLHIQMPNGNVGKVIQEVIK
ncbi:MAG: alkaline phosphatase family protein [Ferruginibacter sp.]|nr:alkaline phosphatase family protein [Ferruginibacter sp.]